MVIFCVLFILISLQGHDCVVHLQPRTVNRAQYLVNGEVSVCVLDNMAESRLSNCIEKPVDKELLFDFNFNEGNLYFFINTNYWPHFHRDYGKTSRIALWRNILPSDLPSCPWTFEEYNEVVGLALDWYHDTIFAIDLGGKRLRRYKCQRPGARKIRFMSYAMNVDEMNVDDIGESIGVRGEMKFKDVQVDPYNKSLFIQISTRVKAYFYNSDFIVRSSLGITDPQITPDEIFSKEMKFYVNVNDQRIYVWDRNDLFVYNYDGTQLMSIYTPFKNTNRFVVFQNILHYRIYFGPERANHIVQVNLTEGPLQRFDEIQSLMNTVQLFGDERTFMLLDARSKRRMVNGTYLCDRTDCKDICEVLPTGDTCVCRKSGAKTRDGLTCYDCGQSNLTSMIDQLLISGGQDASRADFPWHSILYELKDGEWEQICGGTLISPRVVLTESDCEYVLTTVPINQVRVFLFLHQNNDDKYKATSQNEKYIAAHCVVDRTGMKAPTLKETKKLMVAFGKLFRDWKVKEQTEIRLSVKEIRVHEDYMGGVINHAMDIALMVLESKVNYSRFVMPACLDYNVNQLPHYSTLKAYVPGFGLMGESSTLSKQSEELKYATTKVISFVDCFQSSQAKDPTTFLMLTPDRFCVGNGTASAVQKGDSGGGLTLVHKGLHYVSGVVSVKLMKYNGTSFSYSFGSFTNVTYIMSWLLRNLPEGE